MAEIIRMPRLSDTMEEGNIVSWLKKVGDPVKSGDILAEVETDKATMELESFYNGVLLHIGVPAGSIQVGALLAIIGKEGEDITDLLKTIDNKVSHSNEVSTSESKPQTITNQVAEPSDNSEQEKPKGYTSDDGRIKASPLAKTMALDKGLDLSLVQGSGDGGRIIKKDVENFQSNRQALSTTKNDYQTQLESKDIPLTQMRKTIARRLKESKFSAPHFYLTCEINMDNAIAARKDINDGDIKISFNDFVIKACAQALKIHPQVNSSWMGDFIRQNGEINIGVAVATPDGLLVPVVRYVDQKSLSQINNEVKTLAEKAKIKKLSLEEMQGNTFTISNLGMFGIEEFTAIINPPDACILAVGSIISKPIVKDNLIIVGNTMKVTLSCDHRVVDGAVGAQFLQTLKSYLEQPLRMMV